jgi:hypothetical protein
MVLWAYPNVVDGTCEASMGLAMELMMSSNIELLIRSVVYCKDVRVVWRWLGMYRDHGEYILAGEE